MTSVRSFGGHSDAASAVAKTTERAVDSFCVEGSPRAGLGIVMIAACPFPFPRGTPIRILRQAEALAARGHEVHVVTYHLGSGPLPQGVAVHRIDGPASYTKVSPGPSLHKLVTLDPKLRRLLAATLESQHVQIVHAHNYEGLLVARLVRCGARRLVYDAHNLLGAELPSFVTGLPAAVTGAVGSLFDRLAPRLADHTVTVTATLRDHFVEQLGCPAERLSVIENGVEAEHFAAAMDVCRDTLAPSRLVFTGNLAAYQRIDLLLRAFAIVAAIDPDARLVIAADDPFDPYRPLVNELGLSKRIDVVGLPPFAELPGWLGHADICLNPRINCAGMPVKLLNYMAAARAVVSFAGAAPGIPSETIRLAPDADVDAFAGAVLDLLKHPTAAAALGRKARSFVEERYSWADRAAALEALYHRLLAERR